MSVPHFKDPEAWLHPVLGGLKLTVTAHTGPSKVYTDKRNILWASLCSQRCYTAVAWDLYGFVSLFLYIADIGDMGNPKFALRLCLQFSYQPFPSISKPSQESRVLCAYLVANASCSSFYSVAFSAEGCLAWQWANCTMHILVLLLDIFGSVGMYVKSAEWNCLNAWCLESGHFLDILTDLFRAPAPSKIASNTDSEESEDSEWVGSGLIFSPSKQFVKAYGRSRAGEPKKCWNPQGVRTDRHCTTAPLHHTVTEKQHDVGDMWSCCWWGPARNLEHNCQTLGLISCSCAWVSMIGQLLL